MIFTGYQKEEITVKGTNNLNWLKARQILKKEFVCKSISEYSARGAKPEAKVKAYAKWQRILKVVDKYDQNVVVTYNPYLAFLLRFLQLTGKVRIADKEARKANAKAEKEAR